MIDIIGVRQGSGENGKAAEAVTFYSYLIRKSDTARTEVLSDIKRRVVYRENIMT